MIFFCTCEFTAELFVLNPQNDLHSPLSLRMVSKCFISRIAVCTVLPKAGFCCMREY